MRVTSTAPAFPAPARALRGPRGFSLVELMVAVAVVGILAGLAYPSFQSSVLKSRRADAVDGASAVLQAQERWRANNATYTATLSNLNVASTTTGGLYTLALSGNTATAYTLTFTPVAGKSQARDSGCTSLTVSVANGSPTYAPARCWSR
jgi:type IV pilus assembly protein PilE